MALNLRLQTFMFHLFFFSSLFICKNTNRLSHHYHHGEHSEGPAQKQKIKIDLSVLGTNCTHSQVNKDMVSLSSQAFYFSFFSPCVMVEVAQSVLAAAALHSNRC